MKQLLSLRNIAILSLILFTNVRTEGGILAVPNATNVWNFDFTSSGTTKTGKAVTGSGTNDFWNSFLTDISGQSIATVNGLKNAAGQTTSVNLTLEAPNSFEGKGMYATSIKAYWLTVDGTVLATDPMFDGYIWPFRGNSPNGGNLIVTISGLPAGNWTFYVYAHGGDLAETSTVWVHTPTSGNSFTQTTDVWTSSSNAVSPPWAFRRHYLQIGRIVGAGESVTINVAPSTIDNSAINGLQIVPTQ